MNLGEYGIPDIFGRTGLILLDYLSLHNKAIAHGFKSDRLFMFGKSSSSYQ